MKKKYHKTVNEQVHLAFCWGIDDVTENQPVTTAKIWNDTNKVDFFLLNYPDLSIEIVALD